MKALVKERVSPYISQLYECGINDSDIKLVVDQFRSDVSGSSSLFLLRDDDKSDGIKLFASGLTEAQQQFYVQHHRQDVWFNHYLDKGCQGIVSANTLSNSAGLLASFGAQFAAGGVCRVKGGDLAACVLIGRPPRMISAPRKFLPLAKFILASRPGANIIGTCWPWKLRTISCNSW